MRIIVFWDSIAEGFWDYENGGWVNRLKIDFWKKYGYEKMVFNAGISAYTTEHLLNCFDGILEAVSKREAWKEKDTIIIFAIWINDSAELISSWKSRVDLSLFEKNLKHLLEKAAIYSFTQEIIFLANINVDEKVINEDGNPDKEDYFYNKDIEKYNQIVQKVAHENKCWYIDLFWLMQSNDLEDGLHPNAQWHQKIYQKVLEYLEK